MPKRSLNSRVFVWPRRDEVIAAVRRWSELERARNANVVRVGYFGSLASGDYGVGSDVDLVAIVKQSSRAWPERALDIDPPRLPVPADLLVYTEDEWPQILDRGDRFASEMRRVVWL